MTERYYCCIVTYRWQKNHLLVLNYRFHSAWISELMAKDIHPLFSWTWFPVGWQK